MFHILFDESTLQYQSDSEDSGSKSGRHSRWMGVLLSGVVGLLVAVGSAVWMGSQSPSPSGASVLSDAEERMSSADVVETANGTFNHVWKATQGGNIASMALSTAADAHTASWGNWGMRDMSREPRTGWDNSPDYTYMNALYRPWAHSYQAIKDGILVRRGLDRMSSSAFDEPKRVEAFVEFTTGLAYGNLASLFDQAYILDTTTNLRAWNNRETTLDPTSYDQVLTEALMALDRAIQIAENNTFTVGAELTFTSNVTLTSTEFAQLARSYKARFRAQVARTPSERANVDWSAVMSDIENGMEASGYGGPFAAQRNDIPAGFAPVSDGFDNGEFDGLKSYATSDPVGDTWSRADYRTIGPANTAEYADGTNKYDQWKQTLRDSGDVAPEDIYVTETPDRRIIGPPEEDFTCGELVNQGRAGFSDGVCGGNPGQVLVGSADGKYMGFRGTVTSVAGDSLRIVPFVNQPFPSSRGRWHYSDRAPDRYLYYQTPEAGGAFAGPLPILTKPELDLLKAEALLRTGGSLSDVAALINRTRVNQGELPAASSSDPEGTPTDAPNPLLNDGATLWSMLKYEFSLETMLTGGGVNYFADRGWGDLAEGTPNQFPIPGRILLMQGDPIYTFPQGASKSQETFTSPVTITPLSNRPQTPGALEPK